MNRSLFLLGFLLMSAQLVISSDLLKKYHILINTLRYQIIGSRKPSLVGILTEMESKLKSGGSLDTILRFLDNLRGSIDEE